MLLDQLVILCDANSAVCLMKGELVWLTNSRHGSDQHMAQQEQRAKEGGAEVGAQAAKVEEVAGSDHDAEQWASEEDCRWSGGVV